MPEVLYRIGKKYYDKASQLQGEGSASQAREHFQKAATIYEEIKGLAGTYITVQAYHYAGDCYYRLGDYAKSLECYQELIDDYPLYSMAGEILYLIGRNYQLMGQAKLIPLSEARPKTKAVFERLVEQYPDCPRTESAQNWLNSYSSNFTV